MIWSSKVSLKILSPFESSPISLNQQYRWICLVLIIKLWLSIMKEDSRAIRWQSEKEIGNIVHETRWGYL